MTPRNTPRHAPPCARSGRHNFDPDVVLASASAARHALLVEAGIAVRRLPAPIDEAAVRRAALRLSHDASRTARRLAWLKARHISRRLAPAGLWVIGADQMLDCEGHWFDKPGDRSRAAAQLRALSGRTHMLWSAVSLWRDGQERLHTVEPARMTMRALSDAEIEAYLAHEGTAILGCVGSYRFEGAGAGLFARVQGGCDVIMGLPMSIVRQALGDGA